MEITIKQIKESYDGKVAWEGSTMLFAPFSRDSYYCVGGACAQFCYDNMPEVDVGRRLCEWPQEEKLGRRMAYYSRRLTAESILIAREVIHLNDIGRIGAAWEAADKGWFKGRIEKR